MGDVTYEKEEEAESHRVLTNSHVQYNPNPIQKGQYASTYHSLTKSMVEIEMNKDRR